MTLCQICGRTIDAARSQAAELRRKTPTYCSPRCYRAGIKRAYRAKRRNLPSLATGPYEAKRKLTPSDLLEADRVKLPDALDEILKAMSDDQRASIERLAESLAKVLSVD